MAYRAQVGGMFGSGINQKPQSGVSIDVAPLAGVIAQALASRRDGLIHKAMMQREFDRQDAADQAAAEERAYQRSTAEDERNYTRSRNERTDSLAEAKQADETARYRAENGIVPERYEPVHASASASDFQMPTIRSAMQSSMGQFGGGAPKTGMSAPPVPSVGALPKYQLLPSVTDYTLGTKYQEKQTERDRLAEEERHNREMEGQGHYTFTPAVGPDGRPVIARGNTRTGEIVPTDVGRPQSAGGGMGMASITRKIASNQQQFAAIDDALHELDQHPDAIGIKRGHWYLGGDATDQRVDPEGVDARASLANVGSLQIHDRSGAVVTVHEMPRLAPFIPSVSDNVNVARKKLKKLRELILVETGALQNGPGVAHGMTAQPQQRSGGGQTITVNGKTFVVPE